MSEAYKTYIGWTNLFGGLLQRSQYVQQSQYHIVRRTRILRSLSDVLSGVLSGVFSGVLVCVIKRFIAIVVVVVLSID